MGSKSGAGPFPIKRQDHQLKPLPNDPPFSNTMPNARTP